MIRVPIHTWYKSRYSNKYEYVPFVHDGDEVARPVHSKYNPGDVVVVTEDNCKPIIAIVLGIIDVIREDLRTDARGMVSFSQIRPATMKDIAKYDPDDDSGIVKYIAK